MHRLPRGRAHRRLVLPAPTDQHASIIADGETHGRVTSHPSPESFRPDLEIDGRTRRRLESHIMAYFAGYEADRRHCGARSQGAIDGAEHDRSAATMLASYMSRGDPAETDAYLEWLRCRTENQLAAPTWWVAVEAAAGALLERGQLTGRQARAVVRAGVFRWLDEEMAGRPPVTVRLEDGSTRVIQPGPWAGPKRETR